MWETSRLHKNVKLALILHFVGWTGLKFSPSLFVGIFGFFEACLLIETDMEFGEIIKPIAIQKEIRTILKAWLSLQAAAEFLFTFEINLFF